MILAHLNSADEYIWNELLLCYYNLFAFFYYCMLESKQFIKKKKTTSSTEQAVNENMLYTWNT
jgi:hypothetical protein